MFSAKTRKVIKFGLPFMALMVAGGIGILQFSKVRYKYRKAQMLTPKDLDVMGITMKPRENIVEEEYEKVKEMDVDNWQNIRGPRPWEEPSEALTEQRRQLQLRREQRRQHQSTMKPIE